MNNAEGSSVSNVRRADAAAFAAASLMALFLLFGDFSYAHADFIIPSKPWLSATHAGVTVDDASMATISGANLNAVNGNWDITILNPLSSQPAGREGFYAVFRGTYGAMETQGGTPVSGVDYSVVDANVPVGDTSTNHVSFTLPALGDPATPSDTYTIVAGYFPTGIGIYDPTTDTGIDRPTTDADIAHWFADPYDPNVYFPINWISMIPFNYISGTAPTSCLQNCESNVLFIPGIESSRLYTSSGGGERKVWEPGFTSNQSDIKLLYLDSSGNSINSVYTKANGVIDTEGADTPLGITIQSDDVYKTFLQQLAGLKASSTIADYLVFPYDWRMSPADIVNKGTEYNDGTHYLDEELVTLAATSKTGKVTIVAHSNGGLIAKELMIKLQAQGESNLVDKVILVDVPQTGTPETIASMLHGDFQKIPDAGFMASQANARGLAENMPDAYDLLPSAAYFAKVATPVIDLSNAPVLKSTSGITPNTITTSSNLASFITGVGGRQKPTYSDTETPDVLSPTLLSNAATLHSAIDSWQPPAGVQVIQIAGWGIDTPSEVTYSEQQVADCSLGSCSMNTVTRHVVDMTEDGDKTVVIPSQVATTSWSTYYINLLKYNKDTKLSTNHSDITETQPFQKLFSLLLASTSMELLPNYITKIQPISSSTDKILRLRVLSPVSLDAYDSLGDHTGMAPNPNPQSDDLYVEEQIPGSYYQQYGEGQYIGLPAGGNYTIKLHGEDTGTFTFQVTPVSGGVAGAPVTFADVPVIASSTATISLAGSSPASTTLALDVNGDGIIDTTIASSSETTDPLAYAKIVQSSIAFMDIGAPVQKQLQAKFTNMIYLLTKVDQWDTDDDDARDTAKADKVSVRVIRKLGKMETYIDNEIGKPISKRIKEERITSAQAVAIIDMIEELKTLVNANQL